MKNVFLVIALVFVVLWAVAKFIINVGSAFIHLLLIIAVLMMIMNMVKPRAPRD